MHEILYMAHINVIDYGHWQKTETDRVIVFP